ncbi:MAG: glucose-1-phosphate cytidylyltransferase [Novosphingobium sp.]|uniref:glucose-1-phosphate cytidylyltransferase n=1 Tax=Novosphingobium sp. TaxID=1874826 RepID=UPI0032BC4A35
MKAVILCGGQGTRIRDVADDIPKPMIRIGDRPILWHIMQIYAASQISDFVLCLGYKSWSIKEYFLNFHAQVADITVCPGKPGAVEFDTGDFPESDWRIELIETGVNAMTGARLWRVRDRLAGQELFCFTYGDGVADLDIAQVVAFHRRHGKIGTVTGVRPPGRFGVMAVSGDAISAFSEKPQTGEGLINGGFFVFDKRVFDYLDADPGLVFEQEPLRRLAEDGQLMLFEHSGFWQPMDTYREWKLLNDMWDNGQAPWKR